MTGAQGFLSFDEMATALALPEAAEVWRNGWDASQAEFSAERLSFLGAPAVEAACASINLDAECVASFVVDAAGIRENPALCRLFWHLRVLLSRTPAPPRSFVKAWPMLPESHGPVAHTFYAILLLSLLDRARRLFRLRNIPDDVALATLSDIRLWTRVYKERFGVWGLAEHPWLSLHISCGICALGRLQFEPTLFKWNYIVLRNDAEDRAVVIAGDGLRFRTDGQRDGANGVTDSSAWTARFLEDQSGFRGHPLDETGHPSPREESFPKPRWEKVLESGDPVLAIHIPATGPMDFVSCETSIERARAFFPRHFPEHRYRAFTCASWLLDPQLAAWLPERSNIIRFQKAFLRHPLPGDTGDQILSLVFRWKFTTLDSAPQDTSLRRAIVAHLRSGGSWYMSGGILSSVD